MFIPEKVENVKRDLKNGEMYLVPCIVNEIEYFDTYEEKRVGYVIPIINHPHNDIENGQEEVHYHADFRFVELREKDGAMFVYLKDGKKSYLYNLRPTLKDGQFKYIILKVVNENKHLITPVDFIKKSKIKHKCIHKGKCPHRGYDLSQVSEDADGIITCPLHGLQFKNNKLITEL